MTLEKLYTLDDVCEALGMSDRWVRDRIKSGELPITRLGHKIRFTQKQYDDFVAANATPARPPLSITTGPRRRRA